MKPKKILATVDRRKATSTHRSSAKCKSPSGNAFYGIWRLNIEKKNRYFKLIYLGAGDLSRINSTVPLRLNCTGDGHKKKKAYRSLATGCIGQSFEGMDFPWPQSPKYPLTLGTLYLQYEISSYFLTENPWEWDGGLWRSSVHGTCNHLRASPKWLFSVANIKNGCIK